MYLERFYSSRWLQLSILFNAKVPAYMLPFWDYRVKEWTWVEWVYWMATWTGYRRVDVCTVRHELNIFNVDLFFWCDTMEIARTLRITNYGGLGDGLLGNMYWLFSMLCDCWFTAVCHCKTPSAMSWAKCCAGVAMALVATVIPHTSINGQPTTVLKR